MVAKWLARKTLDLEVSDLNLNAGRYHYFFFTKLNVPVKSIQYRRRHGIRVQTDINLHRYDILYIYATSLRHRSDTFLSNKGEISDRYVLPGAACNFNKKIGGLIYSIKRFEIICRIGPKVVKLYPIKHILNEKRWLKNAVSCV